MMQHARLDPRDLSERVLDGTTLNVCMSGALELQLAREQISAGSAQNLHAALLMTALLAAVQLSAGAGTLATAAFRLSRTRAIAMWAVEPTR